MVFFPETDLQQSIKMLVNSKIANNGQVCIAPKRVFVHAAIFDEFKRILIEEIDEVRRSAKFDSGILYGSDSVESTLKAQLDQWKENVQFDGRVIKGSNEGPATQEINIYEVFSKCTLTSFSWPNSQIYTICFNN